MKSFQNSFEKQNKKVGIFLTPSEVVEYLYCPRFTFFMNCLKISQHEEQRYKVILGRQIHDRKTKINKNYLRKKIGCINKDIDVYMISEKFQLKGVVDEVIYLKDGTLAPLDYKFAEYKDFLYRTHKIQSVLYGLLIRDFYDADVKKGFVCYVRSHNLVKEINFKEKDFNNALEIINYMLLITKSGYYPKKTNYKIRCVDCCYRNICV